MFDVLVRYVVLLAVIAVCIALGVWHLCVVMLDRAMAFVGGHAEDFE